MNKSQLIALYNQDQRINITYPDLRREVTPTVVRHIDTSGTREGSVIYSQLDSANADETIRGQIRYFESLGQDFEWKLYDYDQPADLQERLIAQGFTREEAEAILVLDLNNAPEGLWQPVHHVVQRITDPEQLADVQTIEEQVWEEDAAWIVDYLGETLRKSPDQMSVYVAYVNGEPASAAWIYYPKQSQFASLWGGATVSRFRKQGLYRALLAIRAQEAKARQVRFLTVDASPMSQPILEQFGFALIAYSYPCKWTYKPE